jgi:hypothetical protein
MTADTLYLVQRAWDTLDTDQRIAFLLRHKIIFDVAQNPRNIVYNQWSGQFRTDQRRIASAMLKGK